MDRTLGQRGAGGKFIDTPDGYNAGRSEGVVGWGAPLPGLGAPPLQVRQRGVAAIRIVLHADQDSVTAVPQDAWPDTIAR